MICTVERVKRKRGYKQGSDKELPRTDTKRRGLNPTLGVVRTLRCIALDCVAADRMGVGQMEREDFLPSTAATIDLQRLQLAFQMLGSFTSIDVPIFQV